jgi:predicted HTH domain antitoxin
MSKTFSLKLPENVNINTEELKLTVAAYLYEKSLLSLGEAAEVAGVSKRAFIELLGKVGVSIFNYSKEELKSDLKNA